jgi:hypothetical protein
LSYRKLTSASAPLALQSADAWSLFNPTLHAEHRTALQRAIEDRTVPH